MINNEKYEHRLVAFIYLLGFKELVSTFETKPSEFQRTLKILKALDEQKQMVYGFPEDLDVQMEYTTFSDSIVLSSRIPEDPVNTSLYQIAFACSLLLESGLFVRGAIVDGFLYHKNNIILGQGMIDAYTQESTKAIYPRIIVSSNIIDRYFKEIETSPLKEKIQSWSNTLIRKDIDGHHYLDTLQSIPSSMFKDGFIPFLKATKKIVINKLEEHKRNEKVFQKYEWFRKYYNAILSEHPEHNLDLIPKIDKKSGDTLLINQDI